MVPRVPLGSEEDKSTGGRGLKDLLHHLTRESDVLENIAVDDEVRLDLVYLLQSIRRQRRGRLRGRPRRQVSLDLRDLRASLGAEDLVDVRERDRVGGAAAAIVKAVPIRPEGVHSLLHGMSVCSGKDGCERTCSCKFLPTVLRSMSVLIPRGPRVAESPMPESWRRAGD